MKNIIVKSKYHFINSVSEILWLIFCWFLFGIFANDACKETVPNKAAFLVGIVPFCIFLLFIFIKKKCYENISYEIKEESIEDRFTWINHVSHSINYADIKEVILERGILQRRYGLGTVRIITNATTRGAGMTIDNIREYQKVYDFIKEKVKNRKQV